MRRMSFELYTHCFSLYRHPLKGMPIRDIEVYLSGLGDLLSTFTREDGYVFFLFKRLSYSIINADINQYWHSTQNLSNAKMALRTKRKGLHFYNYRIELLFDAFFIITKYDTQKLPDFNLFVKNRFKGIYTVRSIKIVSSFFNSGETNTRIPPSLLSQYQINYSFQKKRIKRVLFVGSMGAGKSTVINAIVGREINQSKVTACTEKLTFCYNKPQEDGIIYRDSSNMVRYLDNVPNTPIEHYTEAAFHFDSGSNYFDSTRLCLIDSPGDNNTRDKSHRIITHRAIADNNYDLLVFVVNANYLLSEEEDGLLSFTLDNCRRRIVYVINQSDCFKSKRDSISKAVNNLEQRIRNTKAKGCIILPLSALAFLSFTNNLHQSDAEDIRSLCNRKFSNDFYDLPSYANGIKAKTKSKGFIDKTGVPLLRYIIKDIA